MTMVDSARLEGANVPMTTDVAAAGSMVSDQSDIGTVGPTLAPKTRYIYVGTELDANAVIDFANANGWPCLAEERGAVCCVMAAKP